MPSAASSAEPIPSAHTASTTSVEWLRTAAALDSVEEEWREFEERVRHRTVLSTFDYLTTWYDNYAGTHGDALIGIARRGGTLIGVAPLVVRSRRIGKVPMTSVEFAAHEAYAGEFLVEDDRPDTMAAFLDSLVRSVRFDMICLNDLDLSLDRFSGLRESVARHRLGIEMTDHPNAIVDLGSGYDAYFRARSAHFRAGIRRHARRIADVGTPVIEGVQLTRGLEELDPTIERMIAINEASYKLKGERLADCHRAFLAGLARRFGPRGMLSLPILRIGDRDAAFVIGLVERGSFYDVTLAYDEAFAHLSPGTHLTQELLRDLASAGVHTFVSHGAHEYKQHWASAFVPSKRLFVFAPNPKARATRFMRFSLASAWRRLGYGEA